MILGVGVSIFVAVVVIYPLVAGLVLRVLLWQSGAYIAHSDTYMMRGLHCGSIWVDDYAGFERIICPGCKERKRLLWISKRWIFMVPALVVAWHCRKVSSQIGRLYRGSFGLLAPKVHTGKGDFGDEW